jgi:hypothetical protein
MQVSGQFHFDHLSLKKIPSTHYIGCWMNPVCGLAIFGEEKNMVEVITLPKHNVYIQENAILFMMLLCF